MPEFAGAWKRWSVQSALEQMDAGNVVTSLLSITIPGLTFDHDPPGLRRFARECNEYATGMVNDHAGRFESFLALPLPDVEGSLAEIAYGLDTLNAVGIGLFSSYGNTWLGDPLFDPVFEELQRRRATVFVHPTAPCCVNLVPGIREALIGYAADTTRALANVVFSGYTRRFPDIRFIWSHAGGAMPYLAWRFEREGQKALWKDCTPNGFLPEARKFYYDTAQAANAAPMSALIKMIPCSHVLFGTDYPYVTASQTAEGLQTCGVFNGRELDSIYRTNALALTPRLSR